MSFLDDIEFPATKQDVIAAAVERDVPQDAIEALQRAKQEGFENRLQVEALLHAES